MRYVNDRRYIYLHAAVTRVFCDTDNSHFPESRRSRLRHTYSNALAERTFTGEMCLRKQLTDHDNERRARLFPFIDFTAEQHRNAHRREKPWSDIEEVALHTLAVDRHAQAIPGRKQWRVRKADVADARNRAESPVKVVVERQHFGVSVTRQARRDFEQQKVLAIESDIDRLQIGEGPPKQARSNQHEQRHGHLRHDEDIA